MSSFIFIIICRVLCIFKNNSKYKFNKVNEINQNQILDLKN